MKNRSKILLALLIVLTLMVGVFAITASAADTKTLYLNPGKWETAGAWYAAWSWKGSGSGSWYKMADTDGDGVYEVNVPSGNDKVIFVRMNPGYTNADWSAKWNQTGDLSVPTNGNNLFTINSGNSWDGQTTGWSKYTYTPLTLTVAGSEGFCGTSWDVANTANDLTYTGANGIYTKVFENVAAGSYEFKIAKNHSWDVSWPADNYVFNVATSGSTITISFNAITKEITVNSVAPVAQVGENYFFNLQDAVDAAADGDTVVLHADFTGDIYFTRAANVDVTINGNGKTFNGSLTIDGKSATYATGSLTIENVMFDATGISKTACINFGVSGNNNTRYITNVSIIKCTFTGGNRDKIAAIRSYTGGDKNITVEGCNVDNTMHSLLQVNNVTGLEIDACTVNSKNGINLNNSSDVVIKNSTVEVSGYAVRAGASSDGSSGSVELTNNTLKTDNTDGDDPVIVIRGLAQKNIDLVMTENVVSGDVHIGGTTADTKVSAEANYWDGQNLPTVSGTEFYVKTYYATPDKTETELAHLVATLNGVEYDSLEAVFADVKDGDEVIMVTAGTYKLLVSGKNITVTASVDGVAFEGMGAYNMGGANVTFNNITFNWTNTDYRGLQHSGNLVYNNCTINGQVFLYGTSEIFNECTFNQTSAAKYNVWTYGAKDVEFNKCTFNSAGKALLVYTEAKDHYIDLVITETAFNASELVAGKAAIEIDTSLTAGASISIDAATTANGFDAGNKSGNSLWNNKKGNDDAKNNDIVITVGGETVLAPLPQVVKIGDVEYTSLQAALNAAKTSATIILLDDLTLTEALVVNGKSVTLDLNGKNLVFAFPKTFALRNATACVVLSDSATLIIDGNGAVLTNGAVFSVEDGSDIEILSGTFDVDVTDYLADGLRVAQTGDGFYGVVANDEKTYIGENGNWFVGDYDTGVVAQPKVEIIEVDGVKYWHVNGVNTGYIVDPIDKVTPEITIIDGVWYIDLKDGNGFVSTPVTATPVDGNGIVSIEKTETIGLVDIYTITYNDGTTTKFTIQNGSNGQTGATGAPGLQGVQGPDGDRGDPGENGVSNNWLVDAALKIAIATVVISAGVVLALNRKRLNWWS